ncbi:transposase [Mesorhizobium sp. ORM16]|uniref:transposase n=1 Tax=Mesorhizobium sp. ORM16 TaxID=3376989 RepID=UPI0038571CB2
MFIPLNEAKQHVTPASDIRIPKVVLSLDLPRDHNAISLRSLFSAPSASVIGVEFVVPDDRRRLRAAIREVLPEAVWKHCYVGLLKKSSHSIQLINH